jgi:hypothetical protein
MIDDAIDELTADVGTDLEITKTVHVLRGSF